MELVIRVKVESHEQAHRIAVKALTSVFYNDDPSFINEHVAPDLFNELRDGITMDHLEPFDAGLTFELHDLPDGQPQTESDGLKQLYCMICQKPMQIVSEMHEHTGINKLYMECATCSDHLASSIELPDTVRQEYVTSKYIITDHCDCGCEGDYTEHTMRLGERGVC